MSLELLIFVISVSCSPRSHLVDMEEETRRELASLQRERELLQEKEKNNETAIDEVSTRNKF